MPSLWGGQRMGKILIKSLARKRRELPAANSKGRTAGSAIRAQVDARTQKVSSSGYRTFRRVSMHSRSGFLRAKVRSVEQTSSNCIANDMILRRTLTTIALIPE